jgi:hypothetical protein
MNNMNNSNKLLINLLLVVFVIILIIILAVLCLNTREGFVQGYGHGFSMYHRPYPPCKIGKNCFRGSYFNGTQYLNMCEPKKGLLKQKKYLIDGRYRRL